VPQLVLRRFADDDGRIVMVARDSPHDAVQNNVSRAGAETGVYRIEQDDVQDGHRDGHDPELVEKALAGLEDAVAPLLADLIEGRFPPPEVRHRVALFVALQLTRGWAMREQVNRLGTLRMRASLRDTVTPERVRERIGQDATDDEVGGFIEQVLGEDGPTLRLEKANMVQQTLRHGFETIAPLLGSRAWRVVSFDRPVLLTSDQPVASWSPPRQDRLPVGVANARETYMPLDRRTALVITLRAADEARDLHVHEPRLSRAARINTAVAHGALRWLFHHSDDTPLRHLHLGPRDRWEEEVESVSEEPDGTLRVRGLYVPRSAVTGR